MAGIFGIFEWNTTCDVLIGLSSRAAGVPEASTALPVLPETSTSPASWVSRRFRRIFGRRLVFHAEQNRDTDWLVNGPEEARMVQNPEAADRRLSPVCTCLSLAAPFLLP